jgi:hypothetical protein
MNDPEDFRFWILDSLANLEKACSAPKEKVYRPAEKRKTANVTNLAKAQVARPGCKSSFLEGTRVEAGIFFRIKRCVPHLPIKDWDDRRDEPARVTERATEAMSCKGGTGVSQLDFGFSILD